MKTVLGVPVDTPEWTKAWEQLNSLRQDNTKAFDALVDEFVAWKAGLS